jgi:eukaryotic-like serine/threonine-protein kinase
MPNPSNLDPSLPEKIGKYPVIQRLGEGATSEVFLARDQFHDRDVAIKRVRAIRATDSSEARYFERFFAAEAALVGRLLHPNVVQIYDAVADPKLSYLVMEYVQGSTLRACCRPHCLLPLELIVEIGFKCAMALGYVYRQGLIHRDIKPANLLTVLSGNQVTDIKVSDFGSALNLDAQTTQVHRVGSLAYMSPEQLDGSALDCRADIYSLGAVLYHLITGKSVFDGDTQAVLMQQIYNQEPHPLMPLRAQVSQAMQQVVLTALAKNPKDRYQTWDSFAKALSGLIVNHQVPRGTLQSVLDSERFNLLRALDFFADFGDVQLWEVVHRAQWQRFAFGQALHRSGEEGNHFHILAQGTVEIFRDGLQVARLIAGATVGEMAYLAPNQDLRRHQADVVATQAVTTISFTPDSLAQLSSSCRHLFDQAFIRVLVRRLHAAHESLVHPRRIL